MDAREFYQVALKIVVGNPPPGAAWCRTAIGRAYFASLNVAVESLNRLGVDCGKGPQKHGRAVAFLHASGDELIKTAAVTLDFLKTERNYADYQLDRKDVDTVSEARKSVERANDVIAALETLDADQSRRTAISGNIRSYINRITRH
jgi:hypothetical protein